MTKIQDIPLRVRLGRLLGRFGVDTGGAVVAIVAILAPVLIGMIGLGTEAGFWYMTQRKLQNAADTGAHAAALRMRDGEDDAAIRRMVSYLAEQSDIDMNDATLVVNRPPATGTLAGADGAVEVIVSEALRRSFSGIYTMERVSISARAVARVLAGGTGCVLALSDATGAITVSGSSSVSMTACDLVSNASGEGFSMNGNGSNVSAGCVQTVGTADTGGNIALECDEARENARAVADPFADVPEPALTGACQSSSVGTNLLPTTVTPQDNHASGLRSRRYCSGLTVRGDVTFRPGLYLIEGGTFRVNSNAEIQGDGVVFYLAPGVELQFAGSAVIAVSAPTSGPYAGIVIFGSRNSVGLSHGITGGAGTLLDGAIYAPTAHLTMSGSARTSANGCTQFVTGTITFTGNGSIDVHCSNPVGNTIEILGGVALVE